MLYIKDDRPLPLFFYYYYFLNLYLPTSSRFRISHTLACHHRITAAVTDQQRPTVKIKLGSNSSYLFYFFSRSYFHGVVVFFCFFLLVTVVYHISRESGHNFEVSCSYLSHISRLFSRRRRIKNSKKGIEIHQIRLTA